MHKYKWVRSFRVLLKILMILPLLLGVSLVGGAAGAQSLKAVPLPKPRPIVTVTSDVPVPEEPRLSVQPKQRVNDKDPQPRVYQTACPAVLRNIVKAKMLSPIEDNRCGLQTPLSVTAIQLGPRTVDLSQPAILNCAMATQIAQWTARIDAYAQAVFNVGITQLHVGTSYMCRTRNRAAGAPVSEHGFANALDITGVTLTDGKRVTLPNDWAGDGAEARFMRQAHTAACGAFTTVLGPDANALHADHLHLDLGCHGATCTAMICE